MPAAPTDCRILTAPATSTRPMVAEAAGAVSVFVPFGQRFKRLKKMEIPGVTLHAYNKARDRFLIIDGTVCHIGASLKDLGKKLFTFSKMEVMTDSELLAKV